MSLRSILLLALPLASALRVTPQAPKTRREWLQLAGAASAALPFAGRVEAAAAPDYAGMSNALKAMIAEDPRQPAFSPTVYCQVLTGSREPRVLKRLAPPMPAASLDQSIGSSAAAKMEAKDETEANREPEETVVREREEDRPPPRSRGSK